MRIQFVIMFLLGFGFLSANAEETIPITFSGTIEHVIFDGRWSFEYEWKQSSLNTYYYENQNKMIVLRSAHYENYIYIFIDTINDESLNNNLDNATICFDSNNDKNMVADHDDFCFTAVLGNSTGVSWQGGHSDIKNGFKQTKNHPNFIGIAGISNENDRYSGVPHVGYEFRIPIDLIGRNNTYGFYFSVYDDHVKKFYTYPTEIISGNSISSPNMWGTIYSPDKSLPEFYVPILLITIAFTFIIFLSKQKNSLTYISDH